MTDWTTTAARPDPARLRLETYPVLDTAQARYGDMDANAHMNNLARARGCPSTQLTTSNPRRRAHAFYARIGFAQSHLGFKRELT